MKLPIMIGLMGEFSAGKDTAADYLVAQHGYTKFGFSDSLYTALLALDPWIHMPQTNKWSRYSDILQVFDVREAKDRFPEIRASLQKLGTEAGRDVHGPDCWVKALARQVRWDVNVCIQDVRFENEIKYIRSAGGILLRVFGAYEKPLPTGHRSQALDYSQLADYHLENSGTREEFHKKIHDWLETLEQETQ